MVIDKIGRITYKSSLGEFLMNFQRDSSHSISTDHMTTVCHFCDGDVKKRNILGYWVKIGEMAEEGAKAESIRWFQNQV